MADNIQNKSKDIKITQKSEGKEYSLTLTPMEQAQALSIMEVNGIDSVLGIKKHNGAAMFFINEQNCDNCMDRHGYDFAMSVTKKHLQ